MKSLFEVWGKVRVVQLNRLLRPFNVRLVEKRSKEWGDKVVITAQAIEQTPAPQTGQSLPEQPAGQPAQP